MNRTTACLVAIVSATCVLVGFVPAASAGSGKEQAKATEVGITDTEIRIAVIADVENSYSPGLNQSNVDAVRGFADMINDGGGIAGRELVVDFYDSKLSPSDTQNALLEACERDFALVGTGANFLSDPTPLVTCPDSAGRPTGIPDLTTFSLDVAYQCAPVAFQISPPTLDCATATDSLETYRVQVGPATYYERRFGDLHGTYVLSGDLESVRDAAVPLVEAYTDLAIVQDGEGTYFSSSVAPRSALTPFVQALKQSDSNFNYAGLAVEQVAALRQEADLQGVDTVKVWTCSFSCYDRTFVDAGGEAVDGQFVTSGTVPFEEAKRVPALAQYLKAVGADNADGFGVQAWTAALLFRDVVDAIVEADGVNGLTRAAFLERVRSVHRFDADGILGPTDVGAKVPSACYMVMRVQDGEFVRATPKEPATFDCKASNRRTIELDLID